MQNVVKFNIGDISDSCLAEILTLFGAENSILFGLCMQKWIQAEQLRRLRAPETAPAGEFSLPEMNRIGVVRSIGEAARVVMSLEVRLGALATQDEDRARELVSGVAFLSMFASTIFENLKTISIAESQKAN